MLDWIRVHIPAWVYIAIVVHLVVLGTVAYLILLERKVASWVQDRIGPNRVGLGFGLPFLPQWHWWGLGQPLADGLKFIVKEDYRPAGADKVLFTLAPGIMITVIIISIAAIPWGGIKQTTMTIDVPANVAPQQAAQDETPYGATLISASPTGNGQEEITYQYAFQIANLNIGVLYILAILSLAVYGVVLGGWASNNKYSFLGGLRATANMVSYEIPLGLAVLCIVLMFSTLNLGTIVEKQCHYWAGWIPAWNCFSQPLAFLMFLVCIHAEANRAPFDLAEAEQELVGGYHTEYSSMRFALFFLAEYAGMITTSAVCVALFFGGWQVPWIDKIQWVQMHHLDPANPAVTNSMLLCIIRGVVFFIKTLVVIFVFMWVRWSLPRFRFDQLMMLAWRSLIPISLVLLVMTSIVVYWFAGEKGYMVHGVSAPMALALLAGNVVSLVAIMFVSTILPQPPPTNRRVAVVGSRFNPPRVGSGQEPVTGSTN